MTKRLRLNQETLSELTTDEIRGVVGGTAGNTSWLTDCVKLSCGCFPESWDCSINTCYLTCGCFTTETCTAS